MKARVKATYYTSDFNEGEIVEIIPNMEAAAADVFNVPEGKCFLCKKKDGTLKYIIATNLQLLSSDDNPDYWTRLEHTYAGMAMQAYIIASHISKFSFYEGDMRDCKNMARSLVKKLKDK